MYILLVLVYACVSDTNRFRWKRTSDILQESVATVEWDIPSDAPQGTYRIQHFGHYKHEIDRNISPYSGVSSQFQVV